MLRRPFASERIQRIDPKTGIKVIQLTSYPLPAAHLLYDWPFITPDNRRLVLFSQRSLRRNAPWDLFRVDADGLNLFQLTDKGDEMEAVGYYGRPASALTLDGATVYGVWGDVLSSVDVETGRMEDLCSLDSHIPEGQAVSRLHLSANGERLFVVCGGAGASEALRIDLESGEIARIALDGHLFACDPTGPRLVVSKGRVEWGTVEAKDGSRTVTNVAASRDKWLTDEDGNDIAYFCPEMYAHATLLGGQLKLQGCGKPPHKCIWLVEQGQPPEKLVEGPYFWHSGASWSGEWIIGDTNWPDLGLQLIHVPSRHFATLCHAGASQDHYEFGHPHPALSPDGSLCVFRSDRSGVAQLYIAHITKEFQERVIAGDLWGPNQCMP